MSRPWLYLACFAAFATAAWGGALAPAQSQPDHDRIANLIKQLGSPKYAEREKASHALEAIGDPALAQLRNALKSENLESRMRAEGIVRRIEDKLAADALLAPKIVRLNLNGVAVADAVQMLSKLSGYSIVLHGEVAQLRECKITFDTGEVTFWEAFDRLCAAGNLVEFQAPENDHSKYYRSSSLPPLPGGGPVQPLPVLKAGLVEASKVEATRAITVRYGTPESSPTWYQGSLRIRLVPSVRIGTTTAPPPVASQVLYGLEITPEPPFRAFQVAGTPTLTHAIDDLGQALKPLLETYLCDDMISQEKARQLLAQRQSTAVTAFRIMKGKHAAKSIKSLNGTVAIGALSSRPERFIIVDDVSNATTGPVLGAKGGFIEIVTIYRSTDGSITLSIRFETPFSHYPAQGELSGSVRGDDQDFESLIETRQKELLRQLIVFGVRRNDALPPYTNDGLPVVLDSNGRLLTRERISESKYSQQDDHLIQQLTMTFRPSAGVGPPAQMVLFGHRLVYATIPFRFENMPLP